LPYYQATGWETKTEAFMNHEFEIMLRSPLAFDLASKAINLMQEHNVWPTPTNYELWLHIAADPECALAQEIYRVVSTGEAITDDVAESLSTKFILRNKINEEVRDAGVKLTQELTNITKVITEAQVANRDYNETLIGAKTSFANPKDQDVADVVARLSEATSLVIERNNLLENRLNDSAKEVKNLRRHLDQVRMEAMTDGLTNLPNRKSFDEALERHFEDYDVDRPLTLAVVDIDHFKRFNDTWGHQTGDQVLRYVASVLARIGRPPRLAARYGGEEFGLLFPNETVEGVAKLLNEARIEIASRVLKRRSTNEDLGCVSISAGLAQRIVGEEAYELLDRADKALYQSKNNGRNQVTLAPVDTKAAA
jgi:diguanylate cyclase